MMDLKPAMMPPITHFRDWFVGCRVTSTVYGYGTVHSFVRTYAPLNIYCKTQHVAGVMVDFDDGVRRQLPPNSRDLRLCQPDLPSLKKQ